VSRRLFLGGLAVSPLSGILPTTAQARTAEPSYGENSAVSVSDPRLILGGGAQTPPAQLAKLLAAPLAQALGADAPVTLHDDGGQDGVTAANLFDNNTEADGNAALLIPGAAIVAAMAGDARVHYDYSRWVSVLLARIPVLTIGRPELHRTLRARLEGLLHDHPVRVAVSRPTGIELASLLGISLLGLHSIPVEGFAQRDQAIAALNAGQVDAIQIAPAPGETLTSILSALPSGTAPLFSCGDTAIDGAPLFADAYRLQRRRAPAGPLYDAWCAVGAGACVNAAMVLPMLTPPPAIALWRRAATKASDSPALRSWSSQTQLTLDAGAESADRLAVLTPNLTALLALRRWLALNEPRWRQGQETRPT